MNPDHPRSSQSGLLEGKSLQSGKAWSGYQDLPIRIESAEYGAERVTGIWL